MWPCKTKRARFRTRAKVNPTQHEFTADSVLHRGQALADTVLRWEWLRGWSAKCSPNWLQEHSRSSSPDYLSASLPDSKAALRFLLWVTGWVPLRSCHWAL